MNSDMDLKGEREVRPLDVGVLAFGPPTAWYPKFGSLVFYVTPERIPPRNGMRAT